MYNIVYMLCAYVLNSFEEFLYSKLNGKFNSESISTVRIFTVKVFLSNLNKLYNDGDERLCYRDLI